MLIVAVGSAGADLPADLIARSGNTPHSKFNTTPGVEYRVCAMALWTYSLGYLVVDDTGRPHWKLAELFRVTDGRLPSNWEFCVVKNREPVLALWGYPSLIRDSSHYEDLIERKRHALETFAQEAMP